MYLKSNKNIFNYYIIYRFRIKVFKLKKNLILYLKGKFVPEFIIQLDKIQF
jgi:hypothetical protein